MNEIKRPVSRYYGGKWKMADWIISHFPAHEVYAEHFCGMASVLMKKRPSAVEIVNDMSDEIVNVFRVLRDEEQSQKLLEALYLTPYARSEHMLSNEFCDDPVEQARRTLTLLTMEFNAGTALRRQKSSFRISVNGKRNAARSFAQYPENLVAVIERLKGVIIENRDAFELMPIVDSDETLHYIDPPYLSRKDGRASYAVEMLNESEHERLFHAVDALMGMVIVSGYESELYSKLYQDWHVFRCQAVTAASKKGHSKAIECIWMNKACYDRQRQKRLF